MNFSLSRRDLVVATASLALLAVPQMAPAQEGAVHVYSGSDSNITDFWRNVIVPGFNEEHPDATIEIVDAGAPTRVFWMEPGEESSSSSLVYHRLPPRVVEHVSL